jgi:hypothetical protein
MLPYLITLRMERCGSGNWLRGTVHSSRIFGINLPLFWMVGYSKCHRQVTRQEAIVI